MNQTDQLTGVLNPQALAGIQTRIAAAQARGKHAAGQVTLVAVTKTFPVETMISAYAGGLRTFGENRIQEASAKLATFPHRDAIRMHLIGHLQSNKARPAMKLFDLIESVDSVKSLRRLDQLAGELDRILPVYLQFNAGRDRAKFGFNPDHLPKVILEACDVDHIRVAGVMTIAPFTADDQRLRDCFSAARRIRDELQSRIPTCADLSMGMSGDFEVAVEEGATHVRIGRALFGERPI
ncbi:MAG: YggS family pyridoxal phosphate-dependent enzyme [Candidatus Marinimicrobia bacterium]|nr:YggS family pyridoxal phosphate-dependent enzyme [Candidatus Neomarinimicrobiota bacterium]